MQRRVALRFFSTVLCTFISVLFLTSGINVFALEDTKQVKTVNGDSESYSVNTPNVNQKNYTDGATSFEISPNICGDLNGLLFKYSWTKKDTGETEVIKDFSKTSNTVWTPPAVGDYIVSVDVKDQNGNINTAEKSVSAYSVKGIDVSEWQHNINWSQVKDSGVSFAMIRSGFGRDEPNQVDKHFYKNVREAQNAGVQTGVYHYSYAISKQDAVNEANFCLKIIKGYKFTYPIAFDIEDNSMKGFGKESLTSMVEAFCSTLESRGYYAMFYCNTSWLNNYLIKDRLIGRFDFWHASWGAAPLSNCGMWQHTSRGSVPGISGNVDCDVAYKDYPAIIKSAHLNGY